MSSCSRGDLSTTTDPPLWDRAWLQHLSCVLAAPLIVNEGNGRFFKAAPGRTWLAAVSSTLTF